MKDLKIVITRSRYYDHMTVFYPSIKPDILIVQFDYPPVRIPMFCKFISHIPLLCVDVELAKLAQLS